MSSSFMCLWLSLAERSASDVNVPDVTNTPISPSLFSKPVKLRMSSTGTELSGLCFTCTFNLGTVAPYGSL